MIPRRTPIISADADGIALWHPYADAPVLYGLVINRVLVDRRLRRGDFHVANVGSAPAGLRAFQTSSHGHCLAHSSVTNG